jgi:hypothetical protein
MIGFCWAYGEIKKARVLDYKIYRRELYLYHVNEGIKQMTNGIIAQSDIKLATKISIRFIRVEMGGDFGMFLHHLNIINKSI